MVVVTEYDFDADAWRATAGHGPDVLLGRGRDGRQRLDSISRSNRARSSFTLTARPASAASPSRATAEPFMLGAVAFEFSLAA